MRRSLHGLLKEVTDHPWLTLLALPYIDCNNITPTATPARLQFEHVANLRVCSVTTFKRLEDANIWAYADWELSKMACNK